MLYHLNLVSAKTLRFSKALIIYKILKIKLHSQILSARDFISANTFSTSSLRPEPKSYFNFNFFCLFRDSHCLKN